MSRNRARPPADVTDAELEVLQVLWSEGDRSTRELTDRLYPDGGTAGYGTVQKLLQRLEAKGCVRRKPRSAPLRFAARVTRDDLIDLRVGGVIDQLCDGRVLPLLSNLLGTRDLSATERDSLRALLAELDGDGAAGT